MLIDEIITLLGDTKSSLTEALLKTKILLHQIDHKELTEWVNRELNGYPEEGVGLPEYRILHTRVLANVSNPALRYQAHPIPLGHLRPDQREQLERSKTYDSLPVIEELSNPKSGEIQRPLPMELNGLLSKGLGNGYKVEQAWCEINVPEMRGILVQVRSRLLDFLLELKGSLGDANTEAEVKQQAAKVDATSMFNNAVFGANTTIVLGHHVNQNVHNATVQGDFGKLSTALRGLGLPEDEIVSLKAAVDADTASGDKPSLEGETGRWYKKLLARAAKGGLQIGVDIVKAEVRKKLGGFLGLPDG